MNPSITTETFGSDSKAWLGSSEGTDSCDSITLDPALMLAVFADGNVPSGVALGKVTATGRYGPYNDGAVDGRAVAQGYLYDGVTVKAGQNAGGALLWEGEVIVANLPANNGHDAAAEADLKLIRHV